MKQQFKKVVNAVDIYGIPVGVIYQGQTTYKSKTGALVSLLVILTALIYIGF